MIKISNVFKVFNQFFLIIYVFKSYLYFLGFEKIPKITKQSVLNVIKSTFKNSSKLSSNVHDDVRTAKSIFDNMNPESLIKGYIQVIKSDPFEFYTLCDNQV